MPLWLGLALPLSVGCLRKPYPPARKIVSDVQLRGVSSDAQPSEILDGLATYSSEKFLGIWDGVAFEYQIYDPELLAKDLERIERFLRARGYYEAKVVVARIIALDKRRVRVELRVVEGAPVLVGDIKLQGLELVPISASTKALKATQVRSGKVFDEQDYNSTKRGVLDALYNSGYAFAKVHGHVDVDVTHHVANVAITIKPGPASVLGPITIRGLHKIPEDKVRLNLGLDSGSTYSQSDLDDARRALSSLGVFTNVTVTPQLDKAVGNQVPILVKVEEAPLRTVRIGGGAKLDALQLSNHLSLGWEHRNLFGGTRHFRADARPGLIYFPTRFTKLVAPNRALFESQLHLELEQPSLFEGRTTGMLTGDFNVFPLLYAETPANEGLVGFAELKGSLGVHRAFWSHRLFIAPSYNWQLELPMDYQSLTIGKQVSSSVSLLDNLVIAFPEIVSHLDFRDNALDPRRGVFLSVSLQAANRVLGGAIKDYRVKPEARVYIQISKQVTLATRGNVGFLFPQDYGGTFAVPETQADQAALARDQQILLFRGFFSGGATSNRGYPFRGVGPRGEVPFLVGTRPLGGVSLWEGSVELRFPVLGPLRAALFTDASNVARTTTLSFASPHLSPGIGLRYTTPIGPVRFDVGYRIPGLQSVNENENLVPRIFGLPIAIHLTLGEAF